MTDMLTKQIVDVCTEYARLVCLARWNQRFGTDPRYAAIFRLGAWWLYDHAPPETYPWLDAIKRILEIDQAVLDPNVVLMRAALANDLHTGEDT